MWARWNSHSLPVGDDVTFHEMKLAQNQVYQQGSQYFRIVHLARLEVHYKAVTNLLTRDGEHHKVSKKEFCRLIKTARLMTQDEVRDIWQAEGAAMTPPITGVAE